jgi:two-component sensor histidine kinase
VTVAVITGASRGIGLVQVIARQTCTGNPEDFIQRFSDRIEALSANQDLLFRNELRGIEIENLVRDELAHFADLVGSRIAVHGPKRRLKEAAAQAIGLALHELATNAGKLRGRSRRIRVASISGGGPISTPPL